MCKGGDDWEGRVAILNCRRLYLGQRVMEDLANGKIYLLLCSATYVSGS